MPKDAPIREVVDLTNPAANVIFNMTVEEARQRVAEGDAQGVREIDGQFALVAQHGITVRMARSLGIPLRYFVAKRQDGPALVVSDRISTVQQWLEAEGLGDQFHPSYTRMVPAHYITEIRLVGCPDPNPTYERFFTPRRESLEPDIAAIGSKYVAALNREITQWLERLPINAPIGVCFSGGIDSGSVFLITYGAMLRLGLNPARLKAFSLSVDGGGEDLEQARQFLAALDLQLFLEPIEVPAQALDYVEAIRVIEDYKPLDIEAGAMTLALCRGIRDRYPDWKYLVDGDGGDENLKDYPIEENPELTIRSVLNNLMLYHEGWGVDSIKHSLTYSGGLSRGCTRTYAPAAEFGFEAFSPYKLPNVIEVAEGIPFIALTGWQHERLYDLKGEIVAHGVKAVTGLDMPMFEKRRFQHGAARDGLLASRFPDSPSAYRQAFDAVFRS
ncbi:MAG: asparagine synthetase B family protein, partial [Gemmatimonadota bacterium]